LTAISFGEPASYGIMLTFPLNVWVNAHFTMTSVKVRAGCLTAGLSRAEGRAMDAGLEAELSPPLQLALAWAPRGARRATLACLALDSRLAGFVRRGDQPLAVQMRLAWWRDMLGLAPAAWPRGDPLLDELRDWRQPEELVALVDGWEALLGEELDDKAITEFALGREKAWAALAGQLGTASARIGPAARAWALADLAANLSSVEERQRVVAEVRVTDFQLPSERALRPLAVLGGLGRRALKRGGVPLLAGRGAALLALRLGMFGR
jgi:phytoene synthase